MAGFLEVLTRSIESPLAPNDLTAHLQDEVKARRLRDATALRRGSVWWKRIDQHGFVASYSDVRFALPVHGTFEARGATTVVVISVRYSVPVLLSAIAGFAPLLALAVLAASGRILLPLLFVALGLAFLARIGRRSTREVGVFVEKELVPVLSGGTAPLPLRPGVRKPLF